MTYSWNVYKIFNNGKRAKAPLYSFSHNTSNIEDYFESNIKNILIQKYGDKINQNKFSIIRSDLPQTSKTEFSEKERDLQLRKKVFTSYLKGKPYEKEMIECVLLFSQNTNWKWRWCVVHAATTHIISIISPEADSYEEAHKWMKNEIEKL